MLLLGYVEEGFCLPFDDVSQLSCSDNEFTSFPSGVAECSFDFCKDNLCADFTPAVCKVVTNDGEYF